MPYVTVKRDSKAIGRVYYEDIGSLDQPVIIMQHGNGNTSQDWHSLGYVQELSKEYRLILIDYIGYGKSDKSYDPAIYTMPGFAADTKTVLDHLSIKEAIFIGGSMGARLGCEIAITPEYAAYFKAFILNGMMTSECTLIQVYGDWAKEGGMQHVVNKMNTVMAAQFPPAVEQSFLNQDPKAYIAANTNPYPAVKDRLVAINKPVQLICGEKSDERAEMEEASTIIPDAEIHVISGADHAQAIWWSQKTVPVMKPFIERVLAQDKTKYGS